MVIKKDGEYVLTDFEYLGNLSATPPWAARHMSCWDCKVSWDGCWDNFECPRCGEGDLPFTNSSEPFEDK